MTNNIYTTNLPLSRALRLDTSHQAALKTDITRQIDFFRPSLRGDGGFDVLSYDGTALPRSPQEIHTTTRLIHSFALAKAFGADNCDDIIDAGVTALWKKHRDHRYGGYYWSFGEGADDKKLTYGHAFVLLAASSAKTAGHPDADRLLEDVMEVMTSRYFEADRKLYADEFTRDWQAFSNYRGMNANMHSTEAHLAAFEATGDTIHLERAQGILQFFIDEMAASHGWRLPEHYTKDWQVDAAYAGNPMFRPQGTTPGHSLELGRLFIQYWDLSGRKDSSIPNKARQLIETAFDDAWRPDGGFYYTLHFDGTPSVRDRYWWPVSEAIGAIATLLKIEHNEKDEARYRQCWEAASRLFIDFEKGGWYPEVNEAGTAVAVQFNGKPDVYHSIQCAMIPLTDTIAHLPTSLSSYSQSSR